MGELARSRIPGHVRLSLGTIEGRVSSLGLRSRGFDPSALPSDPDGSSLDGRQAGTPGRHPPEPNVPRAI